jgi:uncharacterized membrane-anchored protein
MKKYIIALLCILLCGVAFGEPPEEGSDSMTVDEFVASLNFQQGEIVLPNGFATLQLPDRFRYLNPEDAERVLVQAWGNPPGHETLGMLFPSEMSPVGENSWGVIITYEDDGYISDKDADSINYDELIEQMKEGSANDNKERIKQGYEAVELIGWAAQPFYDKGTHKLYWAKEFNFGGEPDNTLNYNIRILGRQGTLDLNAVAGMSQLSEIEKNMQLILDATNFIEGHRYADYDPKIDKAASYGIAAIVAGGLAAKTGLLAKLGALLFAAKKFIVVIIVGIGVFLKRLLKHNES